MICCVFCANNGVIERATFVAPQYQGGDEDDLIDWKAVCDDHFSTWYADIEPERQIPSFQLEEKHHLAHPDHSGVKI